MRQVRQTEYHRSRDGHTHAVEGLLEGCWPRIEIKVSAGLANNIGGERLEGKGWPRIRGSLDQIVAASHTLPGQTHTRDADLLSKHPQRRSCIRWEHATNPLLVIV